MVIKINTELVREVNDFGEVIARSLHGSLVGSVYKVIASPSPENCMCKTCNNPVGGCCESYYAFVCHYFYEDIDCLEKMVYRQIDDDDVLALTALYQIDAGAKYVPKFNLVEIKDISIMNGVLDRVCAYRSSQNC